MWVNPDDPNILIQSNDGGANVSLDGGETWSTQFNQPTAELYQVDVSDGFPYRLYAGQQDNSTISVPSFPPRRMPGGHTSLWESQGGCETGPVVPKPGDSDIVYADCKGRFGLFNRRTGQEQHYYVGFQNIYGHNPKDLMFRFQRVAPIHVSPHDPNRVYHTSQYVHVDRDWVSRNHLGLGGERGEVGRDRLPRAPAVFGHVNVLRGVIHAIGIVGWDVDRLHHLGTEFSAAPHARRPYVLVGVARGV